MAECVKCKKADVENIYRFAIVDVQTTSSTQNYVVAKKTTTTVYEKLASFGRTCVCDECIKKERRTYVLKCTGFVAFFLLCMMGVAAMKAGEIGLWVVYILVGGTLIGGVCAFCIARGRQDAFFAADIRARILANGGAVRYKFVPVNASLYCAKGKTEPDIKTFKERGGLRTGVADSLFEKFVLPGNGDEQIDAIMDSQK